MPNFLVLALTRSDWSGYVLAEENDWDSAVRRADDWLNFQDDFVREKASVAVVVDVRPGSDSIDYRAVGWLPVDIKDRIIKAAERFRQTARLEPR